MPRTPTDQGRKKSRGLFEYGPYWIDTISNSSNLYYYWYDRNTGKNRHRTLGTSDLDEAKEKLIAIVKSAGQDDTAATQDPHMVVVLDCYLKNAPLKDDSWGGAPKALVEAIKARDLIVSVSGFDPVFQGELFEHFHAAGRAPNSIANAMRLASAAIRWVSKWGRRYNLRIGMRQTVISNVEEICDYLRLPYPEPKNQHPSMDGMAKMIEASADDELLRRWFLLTLTLACRPGHTLKARRHRMVPNTRLFNLLPKDEKQTKKVRPTLPLPDVVLAEIAGWPEDHWVDWQLETINRKTKVMRERLEVADFMPSCVRDFMASMMRKRHPHYGVPKANPVEAMVWMGHAVLTKTHQRYGHFDEDYLSSAMASVEAVLLDLDERTGGVLFRQESAKAIAAARREELKAAVVNEPRRRGLTRDLAGLDGKKVVNVGLIEGVQGRFRQVSVKPLTRNVDLSGYETVGSKYVLPHLDAWFEIAQIAALATELLIEYEVVPSRIFVDLVTHLVVPVDAVRQRMIDEIGVDPGGWDKHTTVQAADHILSPPFKYQDPTQPHYPPRGLQHLVGRELGLGGIIEKFESTFHPAPMALATPLHQKERYGWRYYLRNITCWFYHNNIGAFETDVVIDGRSVQVRLFADLLTEKLIEPDEINNWMISSMGCNPGGWRMHSANKEQTSVDVNHFINTTPLSSILDELDEFSSEEFTPLDILDEAA